MSEERRKHLSNIRKKWIADNPEKHPWKKSNKFKSVPCEKVKEYLDIKTISYVSEYQPCPNRGFAIDIAFPDEKIGLEINGNQHYLPTGELKPYYRERADYIESLGWKLYDIHYTVCFKENLLAALIEKIKKDHTLIEKKDYSPYFKVDIEYFCTVCGNKRKQNGKLKMCLLCAGISRRKFNPTKEEFIEKILECNGIFSKVASFYGVSATAINKRCKVFELSADPLKWRKESSAIGV